MDEETQGDPAEWAAWARLGARLLFEIYARHRVPALTANGELARDNPVRLLDEAKTYWDFPVGFIDTKHLETSPTTTLPWACPSRPRTRTSSAASAFK